MNQNYEKYLYLPESSKQELKHCVAKVLILFSTLWFAANAEGNCSANQPENQSQLTTASETECSSAQKIAALQETGENGKSEHKTEADSLVRAHNKFKKGFRDSVDYIEGAMKSLQTRIIGIKHNSSKKSGQESKEQSPQNAHEKEVKEPPGEAQKK